MVLKFPRVFIATPYSARTAGRKIATLSRSAIRVSRRVFGDRWRFCEKLLLAGNTNGGVIGGWRNAFFQTLRERKAWRSEASRLSAWHSAEQST